MSAEDHRDYLSKREHGYRGFWTMACFLLIVTGCILAGGRAEKKAEVIEAQEFVVRDSDGKVRCRLGLSGSDVGLTLYDSGERRRILIEVAADVGDDRARVMIFDPGPTIRAALGSIDVPFGDADMLVERPSSSLVLFSAEEEPLWRAPDQPWVQQE